MDQLVTAAISDIVAAQDKLRQLAKQAIGVNDDRARTAMNHCHQLDERLAALNQFAANIQRDDDKQ